MTDHAPAPTLIEVWAPGCSACRAVETDLLDVAGRYEGRVLLDRVNAREDEARVSTLGVIGTPTFIGVREGDEVFRRTGRASHDDIDGMFRALVGESSVVPSGDRIEPMMSIGAGAVILGAAALTGPSLPLAVIGACLALFGVARWVRRGRGD